MKKVLMTNLYFEKYSGSELHISEMARLFERKGYDVTIAVFRKAYPLMTEMRKLHIIECQSEELKEFDFDIIFVQHFPVFDYLCCKYNLTFRKLVVSKLSVISEVEELPVCIIDADVILCVSEECAELVRKQIGVDERIRVFKNCVGQEFFDYYQGKELKKLKKIAVISNHIPLELKELPDVLGKDYIVDFIGVGNNTKLVNAKVLSEYDLIITIGRTVQQCFAVGVPVYVYDYFGGPGYIDGSNFILAEKYNFSGRGFSKLSANELADDIKKHYNQAVLELAHLHSVAQERYNYVEQFDLFYSELFNQESDIRKAQYYTNIEKSRIMTYNKVMPIMLGTNQRSQLFFNAGDGFCEENSIVWYSVENYKIRRTFSINGHVSELRFDPCEAPCRCKVYEFSVNGKKKKIKQLELIITNDPQFIISLSEVEKQEENLEIEIVFQYELIPFEEVINTSMKLIDGLKVENARLKQNFLYRFRNKIQCALTRK